MTLHTGPIIDALIQLAEVQEFKVTVVESLKGAAFTGGCAFVGGLVGGPIGLGVGGVVGACLAAAKGHGKYKSLVHVIQHDMTYQQKEQLALCVQRAVANIRKEDILMLLPLLLQGGPIQTVVINTLKSFLLKELGMRLT
ncbi:protein Nazo-like [Onthophagus taurus]|uniref:protein Nazo-like n=1 Tax=Onthophagus taurus TaxID=166361 RepID=UPI000C1FDB6C|nr:protein C19orf12 homolog [Onthophagus taurus]XP_022910646.1 protein C19orf12 homolog [Onthophagus taurus]XP_022910647.1 protein C19orf12 homolog [Onthophagus taurus]